MYSSLVSFAAIATTAYESRPVEGTTPVLFILIHRAGEAGEISTTPAHWASTAEDLVGWFAANGAGHFSLSRATAGDKDASADGVVGFYELGGLPAPDAPTHIYERRARAIEAADKDFDFAKYDVRPPLGVLTSDELMPVVIAAQQLSAGSPPGSARELARDVVVDGRTIKAGTLIAALDEDTAGLTDIAHEVSHAVTKWVEDTYYNELTASAGIHGYSAMGASVGSGRRVLHDAWTRLRVGWVDPIVVVSSGMVTLPTVGFIGISDRNVAKIGNPAVPEEYFLVESRWQQAPYDSGIPVTGGLAIWHVDERNLGKDNSKNQFLRKVDASCGTLAPLWGSGCVAKLQWYSDTASSPVSTLSEVEVLPCFDAPGKTGTFAVGVGKSASATCAWTRSPVVLDTDPPFVRILPPIGTAYSSVIEGLPVNFADECHATVVVPIEMRRPASLRVRQRSALAGRVELYHIDGPRVPSSVSEAQGWTEFSALRSEVYVLRVSVRGREGSWDVMVK